MCRRRHRSRHFGDLSRAYFPASQTSATRRLAVNRKGCGLLAALTAIALAAATVVLHYAGDTSRHQSHTAASCGAVPKLDTDTSASTLLGVNATSPSQLTTATAEFGHLPILRIYDTGMPDPDAWTIGVQALNHSAILLSFRSPPANVLSGADDAALAHFFDTAPTGHPIYYSYYHEPEPLIENGDFTLTQYEAAWRHIVALADKAHNPYLKSTLILMSWDLNPASGINWKDYLPAGKVISTLAWDAYPAWHGARLPPAGDVTRVVHGAGGSRIPQRRAAVRLCRVRSRDAELPTSMADRSRELPRAHRRAVRDTVRLQRLSLDGTQRLSLHPGLANCGRRFQPPRDTYAFVHDDSRPGLNTVSNTLRAEAGLHINSG